MKASEAMHYITGGGQWYRVKKYFFTVNLAGRNSGIPALCGIYLIQTNSMIRDKSMEPFFS
jgi:hypothetical protein